MDMVDTYEKFRDAAFNVDSSNRSNLALHTKFQGFYHCPDCQGIRKIDVEKKYVESETSIAFINNGYQNALSAVFRGGNKPITETEHVERIHNLLAPSLWIGKCRNCEAQFTFVVYKDFKGTNLAVFSNNSGGISTPNTPNPVAYYLDQASKSHAAGANSAAMAMYRAAVEQVLFEQGYTVRMLGKKINELINDIAAGKAKSWALGLDTEVLLYLKKLGDGAIHPNDGDVERQEALDNELIARVISVINLLLFNVYEKDALARSHLQAFRSSEIRLNGK